MWSWSWWVITTSLHLLEIFLDQHHLWVSSLVLFDRHGTTTALNTVSRCQFKFSGHRNRTVLEPAYLFRHQISWNLLLLLQLESLILLWVLWLELGQPWVVTELISTWSFVLRVTCTFLVDFIWHKGTPLSHHLHSLETTLIAWGHRLRRAHLLLHMGIHGLHFWPIDHHSIR